jgi:hypothetical protein
MEEEEQEVEQITKVEETEKVNIIAVAAAKAIILLQFFKQRQTNKRSKLITNWW